MAKWAFQVQIEIKMFNDLRLQLHIVFKANGTFHSILHLLQWWRVNFPEFECQHEANQCHIYWFLFNLAIVRCHEIVVNVDGKEQALNLQAKVKLEL